MGDLARILIILATAPIWVSIARALWAELNQALANEGGQFRAGEVRRTSRAEGLGWQSTPIVDANQRLGRRRAPAGAQSLGRRRLPSAHWN